MTATQQFHEGQEVEVARMTSAGRNGKTFARRKAEIVSISQVLSPMGFFVACEVQFPDGTRGMFDAAHLRAVP